jgi:hypothetical protein
MEQFFGGLALIFVGLLLTFAGYQLLRVLIPIWGFIAGFSWMVDVFALGNGAGFLTTVLGFFIALAVGIAFAAVAYFFYEFAVALFATSVGYWFVAGILLWMGLPFGFFGVLTALVAGIALAFATLYYHAPKGILVLLSAVGGGALLITGVMYLFGAIPFVVLGYGFMGAIIKQSIFWTLTWIGLTIIGIVSQQQLSRSISSNNALYPTYTQTPYAGSKGGTATKDESNDKKTSE